MSFEERKQKQKEQYVKNREKILQKKKEQYQNNKILVRAKQKEYYDKNAHEIIDQKRRYKLTHTNGKTDPVKDEDDGDVADESEKPESN